MGGFGAEGVAGLDGEGVEEFAALELLAHAAFEEERGSFAEAATRCIGDSGEAGVAFEFGGFDFVGDEDGESFGREGFVAGGVETDGLEDVGVGDAEFGGSVAGGEGAVEDDRGAALGRADLDAGGEGAGEHIFGFEVAEDVVSGGGGGADVGVEAVRVGKVDGGFNDAAGMGLEPIGQGVDGDLEAVADFGDV